MSARKRTVLGIFVVLVCVVVFFRIFCGIFVIQPIGALPEGVTIIYWRYGLHLPFVASADGMLVKTAGGVTLLGRGMMLAAVGRVIKERRLVTFGYSDALYLWSTGGKRFESRAK